MDTAVNLKIVGSEMDHIEALRDMLEPLLGSVPAIEITLSVTLGAELTVITANDNEIVIREQPSGRIVAQGDWNLARAGLAGMPPSA